MKNIVLIGFMCSGKSRIGRALAQRLSWDFVDTDDLIIKESGLSIADFIRTNGEPSFREIEKTAVKSAAARSRTVIATGGGVPLDTENMSELAKEGEIVWLKVTPETVLKRDGNFSSRPLIDAAHPLESIRTRLAQREPFYSRASYVIATDAGNPHDVVEKIISFFPSVQI